MSKITLTFDNGPDAKVTPVVLDMLASRDIQAVFFVIGSKVIDGDNLQLLHRMQVEGHWIGNHTWSHGTPFGELADPNESIAEIAMTQEAIEPFSHVDRFFRPFGGGGFLDRRLLNHKAVDYLCREGYSCIIWNNVPRDWERPDAWVTPALQTAGKQPWSVLVVHDFVSRSMAHLPEFIDRALEAGHEFVLGFPDDCVPIRRGVVKSNLEGWMPL
jgi:peptidoglycan-N-acetylglucosamine deacetylase